MPLYLSCSARLGTSEPVEARSLGRTPSGGVTFEFPTTIMHSSRGCNLGMSIYPHMAFVAAKAIPESCLGFMYIFDMRPFLGVLSDLSRFWQMTANSMASSFLLSVSFFILFILKKMEISANISRNKYFPLQIGSLEHFVSSNSSPFT